MKVQIPKLIISILIPLIAGFIGSVFTSPAIPTWYASLARPSFNPPNGVFAPVWTTLFILMGMALYLVWQQGFGKKEVKKALTIFGVQLVLNILWSILFFGLRNPSLALVDIVLLWVLILATMLSFAKISKPAAWLLIPYLAWVSFASILNFAIWKLNF